MLIGLTSAPVGGAQGDRLEDPGVAVTQFELSADAGRDLSAARELVMNAQWKPALALLTPWLGEGGAKLVEWDARRLISARSGANLLLATFPRAELEGYRRQIDPAARRWFEAGGEEDLQRVVSRAYHSQYTDQALLRLGDLAFERGDLDRACEHWEQLLPPWSPEGERPAGIPPVPFYPHSTIPLSEIEARLVLVDWIRDPSGAGPISLSRFQKRHAGVAGPLAGRQGPLGQVLVEESANQPTTQTPGPATVVDLGGDPTRGRALPQGIDVGSILWSLDLPPVRGSIPQINIGLNPFERQFSPRLNLPVRAGEEVLATHPVVYREGVYWCDETTIHGCGLVGDRQGRALWGNSTALYSLDGPRPMPRLTHGVGLPACTVMIAEGRLFARLGRGVAPRAADINAGGTLSTLVALDLDREGDLLWTRQPEQCGVAAGNWAFEGTPVFHRGRLFVLLRKTTPQVTLQLACLVPATGQLEWSQPVCTGTGSLEQDFDEQHQLLLAASEGWLFCATQLGSVIALDARQGSVEWVARYPHEAPLAFEQLHRKQQLGPSPCVVADGLVLVAPTDSDSVWAFQRSSGVRLWTRQIPGQARQVLGISANRVIVASDQLWGLNPETGETEWATGVDSPEARTAGRGLLAGGLVYWPQNDEILVVDAGSGRRRRRVELTEQFQTPGGGNLAGDYGFLVCAQRRRLMVFAHGVELPEAGEGPPAEKPDGEADGVQKLCLGLHAEARQDWPTAAAHYATVVEEYPTANWRVQHWHGESLDRVARRRGGLVWLRAAQLAEKQSQWELADRWWNLATRSGSTPAGRARAGLQWAESLLARGRPEVAAPLLEELAHDPELIREPRDLLGTRLVGAACEVLLARAREQGGDAVERVLEQLHDQRGLAALKAGAPWRMRVGWSLPPAEHPESPLRERGREQARRMGAEPSATGLFSSSLPERRDSTTPTQPEPTPTEGDPGSHPSAAESNHLPPAGRAPDSAHAGVRPLSATWPEEPVRFPLVTPTGVVEREQTPDRRAGENGPPREQPPHDPGGQTGLVLRGGCRWRARTEGQEQLFPMSGLSATGPEGWILLAGGVLRCLESSTGVTRWWRTLAEPVEWAGGNLTNLVLATPEGVSGLKATTGELVWHHPLDRAEPSPASRRWRIEGSLLVLLEPSRLQVVDLAEGVVRWLYRSPTATLGRYWMAQEGRLAIQQTAPPRTLFFQLEDGYLQSVETAAGQLWQEDPRDIESGRTWGLGRGTEGYHLVEFDRATITTVGQGPRWNELQRGFQAGDKPVGSDAFLAFRDGRWMSLRDPFSGRSYWRVPLLGPPGSAPPQVEVVEGRIYALTGNQLTAWRGTPEGSSLWSEAVLTSLARADAEFACGDTDLLVWNRRGAGELRVEARELRTGELRQTWRLPGRPVGKPVQRIEQGALLLTDSHVALYQRP